MNSPSTEDTSRDHLDSVADFLNHIKNSTPKNTQRVNPSKDKPEEAKNQVYQIYKKKLPNFEHASGELAPIFGLGNDLIAKQRAQSLFKHPSVLDAYAEFTESYLEGRWDLAVGDWEPVHSLFHDGNRNADWGKDVCPDRAGWSVNHYYARFIIRSLYGIRQPRKHITHMVFWLKEANLCNACWVLMHALMYLQLETMRDYKKHAPAKDRISHTIGTWKANITSPKTQ
ncbi:hypothetical protein F4819DRAFT_508483 [Hypoxylon fuscum]|nr:hypothetical protein F4819DRAFT_508483 [Hypoxylon fuscum]